MHVPISPPALHHVPLHVQLSHMQMRTTVHLSPNSPHAHNRQCVIYHGRDYAIAFTTFCTINETLTHPGNVQPRLSRHYRYTDTPSSASCAHWASTQLTPPPERPYASQLSKSPRSLGLLSNDNLLRVILLLLSMWELVLPHRKNTRTFQLISNW